ncbi:FAD/NAD(P)-binding domain-containing protein [Wolfiporia cocos MD-104 SS10]|uniref:FAD/NAD(P)-binding domain-containing protein n=1 Tax=Wolfiporia cocos (strain MD-104) TaxID=742152 RepID=A0A2H3JXW7_WOLCO|nr:FAD/NAD(P)-binding domain-containing protein [Wolfiporia cocos MD-104 SS10]
MSEYRKAPLQLHVLIIGCGIGGLSAAHCISRAGHRVTLFETASAIREVGAGMQLSSNVTRLLLRWGLGDTLAPLAVEPEASVICRYDTGERIGYMRVGRYLDPGTEPFWQVHRADLHGALHRLVEPHVTIRLSSTIVSIDPNAPSVTLASGEVIKGDLVIGADGIKGVTQQVVLGRVNEARATGDAMYRALIPMELLVADPDLRPLVEQPGLTIWMGPERHVVGYNIRANELYNLAMIHPDDDSVESWTAPGDVNVMRTQFGDFEPRIQKLLSLVESTLKWRLMDRLPLPTWVHRSGRVALLGDACHPMLPYRAQGAAMAIEDAAVLGILLSHVSSVSQLPNLLRAYESVRLPRASQTQTWSTANQNYSHLPDGPEQEARDAALRKVAEKELAAAERMRNGECVPVVWHDRNMEEQYKFDAEADAERWWQQAHESLEVIDS